MADSLDANWIRVTGYLVIAGLSVAMAVWERRRRDRAAWLLPSFWWLTAGLMVAMAVGRLVDVGDIVADLGRERARESGWYDERRTYQAIVVGGLGAVWCLVVLIALWRVPARRRRYLPMALVVFTLLCFGAVRVVSLHQVDAVLHRREVAGVRIGAVVELALLLLATLAVLWARRSPLPSAGGRQLDPRHGERREPVVERPVHGAEVRRGRE